MDEQASCGCVKVVVSRKHPGFECHECADCGARFMRAALYNPERERTAATILAALIHRGAPLEVDNLAETSVLIADALRAELSKKGTL